MKAPRPLCLVHHEPQVEPEPQAEGGEVDGAMVFDPEAVPALIKLGYNGLKASPSDIRVPLNEVPVVDVPSEDWAFRCEGWRRRKVSK